MAKKLLTVLLALCMCAGILAGCGGGNSGSNGGSTPASNAPANNTSGDSGNNTAGGDPVELNMVMISMGLNLEDAGKVQDAINEHIKPLINATVKIEWLDMGDYVNQMNLKFTSGESIDVSPTFGAFTSMWYAQDALSPLDDYIAQYGQGIVDAVGENYMKAGYIDGKLYAIPCITTFAQDRVFYYRQDLADQYGVDFSGVKKLEDLTPIFAQLHEKDPSLTLVIANNPNDPMLTRWDWDGLGDEYGVLMDMANSTQVVNLYETAEYKAYVTLMHEWYQAGYVQTDATTTSDNMATLIGAGNAFGTLGIFRPSELETQSMSCGYQLGIVELSPYMATTTSVSNAVFTVPTTAKNPAKAVEFINLLYTDPALLDLLYYGIEGEHYRVVDGRVDYLEGQNMMTCKYVNKFVVGNTLIAKNWVTDSPTLHDDIVKANTTAVNSKALGFSYNSFGVANELAALDTVKAKYRRGLECGALDPETALPKFIDELKAAGIDTVIAEKQAQLDAWLAAN